MVYFVFEVFPFISFVDINTEPLGSVWSRQTEHHISSSCNTSASKCFHRLVSLLWHRQQVSTGHLESDLVVSIVWKALGSQDRSRCHEIEWHLRLPREFFLVRHIQLWYIIICMWLAGIRCLYICIFVVLGSSFGLSKILSGQKRTSA